MIEWFGLASFAYYIKLNKNNSIFEKNGNQLFFYPDRKREPKTYFVFHVIIDQSREECGWVYASITDLDIIFNSPSFINLLQKQCRRYNPDIKDVTHCHLEESKWGRINTVLNEPSGFTVRCLRPSIPVPPIP